MPKSKTSFQTVENSSIHCDCLSKVVKNSYTTIMQKVSLFLFMSFCIFFTSFDAHAQQRTYKVCFYNVENFFDCVDDSLTHDDDFTPWGVNHWNEKKFNKKKADIAKTFLAIGRGDPPAVIGLCEIENAYVLNALCKDTPLRTYGYRYIHYNSRDRRGIDVALIYRPDCFHVFSQKNLRVNLSEPHEYTRDILYVGGTMGGDTLHCFVCHFPSQRGGKQAEKFREEAAFFLRKNIDSIAQHNQSKVIVMGDFNESPEKSNCLSFLHEKQENGISHLSLVNLMLNKSQQGPYFFKGQWEWIDHFIVSKNMLTPHNGLHLKKHSVRAVRENFLLEYSEKYLSHIPFRTYKGPAYHGGISDHLPIVLELLQ